MQMMFALSTFMRMLHAHYGKQVILLIDEYDVPLDKSSQRGDYEQMVRFLRVFFGEALKAFVYSKTHEMLENADCGMTDFGAKAVFEIWECEKVTGDPRNSVYIRGE